jgi:hypothetical protein
VSIRRKFIIGQYPKMHVRYAFGAWVYISFKS